ncbi:hypothetical protein [Colwellia sp. MEBiC06753]
MFTKYIKPVLVFNRSQHKAPNFLLVYCLIWLLWHSQFLVTLITTSGGISAKYSAALNGTEHQYLVVFFLTCAFFIARLTWLYFSDKADKIIEQDEPIEQKIGSDQIFTENKDVVRLLDLLEQTKASLAKVKESEAQAKLEKNEALARVRSLEAELEEVSADLAILTEAHQALTAKVTQTGATA